MGNVEKLNSCKTLIKQVIENLSIEDNNLAEVETLCRTSNDLTEVIQVLSK